jgi:hypothetical protein
MDSRELRASLLEESAYSVQPWARLMSQNRPGGARAGAPLYVAQGTADAIVRPSVTSDFVRGLCGHGEIVQFDEFAGVSHVRPDGASATAAIQWIRDRFDRKAASQLLRCSSARARRGRPARQLEGSQRLYARPRASPELTAREHNRVLASAPERLEAPPEGQASYAKEVGMRRILFGLVARSVLPAAGLALILPAAGRAQPFTQKPVTTEVVSPKLGVLNPILPSNLLPREMAGGWR